MKPFKCTHCKNPMQLMAVPTEQFESYRLQYKRLCARCFLDLLGLHPTKDQEKLLKEFDWEPPRPDPLVATSF